MSRNLPSLNGLKAFEAAARHLSFTRAAAELNVTQAAVSHQVKGLEERLGVALFRRLNRALLLTDEGQALFPTLSESFDKIAAAVARLHEQERAGVLTISTLDSIAASWLVPRMAKFRSCHPDIEVRISTSDDAVDFAIAGIDMALRYGTGDYPGLHSRKLMGESLFPVVSPLLLEERGTIKRPADLARFLLLHDDMRDDWATWMDLAGETGVDTSRGQFYAHSNLVIQAAIAGEGVALGRSVLVVDALDAGLLVRPFDIDIQASLAYFAVAPEASADRPKVAAFRDWLVDEALATETRFAEFLTHSN